MKIRKLKCKHSHPDAFSLRGVLSQPPAGFYRLPEFSVRDGCLTTEGCRKVLDFTPEKICLDMGDFLVTFYGKDLQIESLAGKRAILAGQITDISFRNKWGEASHEA